MRFFRKRFIIAVFAALLAVFLVFSNPAPRQSEAAYGAAIMIAAIKFATKIITDMIMNVFKGMIGSMFDTVMKFFLPFMEKTWEEYATEERAAEVEMTSQEGDFAQAEASQDFINQIELDRLNDVRSAKISRGECKLVTAANLGTKADVYTREYEAFLREEVRKDQGFVRNSFYDKGPIVANKKLRQERFSKFCSRDEFMRQDSTANPCSNWDESRVDKDKATHMMTGCNTIRKNDEDAVFQMMRYLNPPMGNLPLPKSVANDVSVQDAYLARNIASAKNEPYQAFIMNQISRHMEPSECPRVTGSNVSALDFVNAIDARLERPPIHQRPCPSQAELECYIHKYMIQDPAFIQDCNEGVDQMDRCILGLNALRSQLAHDSGNLRDFQLLMGVVEQASVGGAVSPPVDSIGR